MNRRDFLRGWVVGTAMLVALGPVLGCGDSGTTAATGPAGDNRTPEQKESDDMMQKALQGQQKKAPRRR